VSNRTPYRARHTQAGVALLLAAGLPLPAAGAPVHDVVLAGGRVMDPGTRLDAVRHVGIDGNRIAVVSEQALEGRTVIDASGLVVAPGFVDIHAHGQNNLANAYQARDGVTTALELEIGVAPVALWYRSRAGQALINYGAAVSHTAARTAAMLGVEKFRDVLDPGGEGLITAETAQRANHAELSPEQLEVMLAELARGLDEGALGVGLGIQYVPGARRSEIYRVFQLAARRGVPAFAHSRITAMNEPDCISALQELIADAAATGAAAHMMHINSSGIRQIPTMMEMMAGARERGIDISTDAYPYAAANTGIGSAIFDDGWQQRVGIGYGDIEWVATGERLTEESFERLRREQPWGSVIAHFMPEDMVDYAIAHPEVIIASDSGEFVDGRGHPRTAGSFSRVLGRYVRERRLLDLMEALRKMTFLPAERLAPFVPAMARKGRLQPGADADVTVFDPATVIDHATYAQPMQYSTGVMHVLVGGTFVVRDGAPVEGVFPGTAVLRASAGR
jgi:dihydroorotase